MIAIVLTSLQKINLCSQKYSIIVDNEVDYDLCAPMVKPFLMLYMTLIVMFGEPEKYYDFENYLLESCMFTYILFGIIFSQSFYLFNFYFN